MTRVECADARFHLEDKDGQNLAHAHTAAAAAAVVTVPADFRPQVPADSSGSLSDAQQTRQSNSAERWTAAVQVREGIAGLHAACRPVQSDDHVRNQEEGRTDDKGSGVAGAVHAALHAISAGTFVCLKLLVQAHVCGCV